MAPRAFRPKIDWWLPGFLAPILVWTTVIVLLDQESGAWARILVLVVDALILWLFLATRYHLEESELRVTFGPLRFTYPLREVFRVRKGGWWAMASSIREPRLRLAFSTDNVIVESRRRGRARRVVISPKDPQEFLRLLRERAPQVQVEGF